MKYIKTIILLLLVSISLIKGQFEYNTLYYYDTRDDLNVDFQKDYFDDGIYIIDEYREIVGYWYSPYYGLEYQRGYESTFDRSGVYELIHDDDTFRGWTYPYDSRLSTGSYPFALDGNAFKDEAFFPVDDMGFGNDGEEHNYKWCVRMRFNARVHTNTTKITMRFGHSDDLFIARNEEVVYANIGIQAAAYGYLEIDYIKPGEYFDLDIINCNRKRRQGLHLFSVELFGFDLSCTQGYDYCGVCGGDNDCGLCTEDECHTDELKCETAQCTDYVTCSNATFNCDLVYPLPDKCTTSQCVLGEGCSQSPKVCNDYNPCTTDSCDPLTGCKYETIPNCRRCSSTHSCITDDECHPNVCLGTTQCQLTDYECPSSDPCHEPVCISEPFSCDYIYICTNEPSGENVTIDSSELPPVTTYETTSTTISTTSTTTAISTTTASTIASTVGTTIATTTATSGPITTTEEVTTAQTTIESTTTSQSTTGSTVASTVGTTIASTVASTVAETSTTSSTIVSPTTTSATIDISTIGASTISTISTIGTETISETLSTTGYPTRPPISPTQCLSSSCPEGYDCIQLKYSYTCVPCYFVDHCDPSGNLLKLYY